MTHLTLLTTLLAFLVIVVGAYVRLSDAGLGCPDWPGCYGHLMVPIDENTDNPLLNIPRAWKEMIHRYLAGGLGMMILIVAIKASLNRKGESLLSLILPWFLVGLVIFQALLGMWTVTIKLHPTIVMAHLIGGLTTVGLLWWFFLKTLDNQRSTDVAKRSLNPHNPARLALTRFALTRFALFALVILIFQILLGGWTSANYASLACPDFPTCHGSLWPPMNFKEAFLLTREVGINYEGGVLGNEARITIHMMHRFGALIVFFILGITAWKGIRHGKKTALSKIGGILLILLITQIALGISNVLFVLSLPVAVAHNAVAALLFLTLILIVFMGLHPSKPL